MVKLNTKKLLKDIGNFCWTYILFFIIIPFFENIYTPIYNAYINFKKNYIIEDKDGDKDD